MTADIQQQAVPWVMMPSVEAASMAAFTPFHSLPIEVNNNNNHQAGSNLAYLNAPLDVPKISDSAYDTTCTSAASSGSESLQAETATSNSSDLLDNAKARLSIQKTIPKLSRKSKGKSLPLPPPFKPYLGDKRGGKAAFVSILFEILRDPGNSASIHWTSSGTAFIVENIEHFQDSILPKHYNHKKFSSFVRQLHAYGFKRLSLDRTAREKKKKQQLSTNPEEGGKTAQKAIDYWHPLFQRDRPDLLGGIARELRTFGDASKSKEGNASSSETAFVQNVAHLNPVASSQPSLFGTAFQAESTAGTPFALTAFEMETDAWKAILGPRVSDERSMFSLQDPVGRLYDFAHAATAVSTPQSSTVEDEAETFYGELSTPFRFPADPFTPKFRGQDNHSLSQSFAHLPNDRSQLVDLLQQTQTLTSRIEERLYHLLPPWRTCSESHWKSNEEHSSDSVKNDILKDWGCTTSSAPSSFADFNSPYQYFQPVSTYAYPGQYFKQKQVVNHPFPPNFQVDQNVDHFWSG